MPKRKMSDAACMPEMPILAPSPVNMAGPMEMCAKAEAPRDPWFEEAQALRNETRRALEREIAHLATGKGYRYRLIECAKAMEAL